MHGEKRRRKAEKTQASHKEKKKQAHTRAYTIHTDTHAKIKREEKQDKSTLSIERVYIQMIEAKKQVSDALCVCVCVYVFSSLPFGHTHTHTRTQNEKMMKGVEASL